MNPRSKNKIRLYVDAVLTPDAVIELEPADSHYLCNVMRLSQGAALSCFNAACGEYDCRILEAGKKHCRVSVLAQIRKPMPAPDVWLLFAPLKKDKTDFVIEKAVELGVREIVPVITRNTISEKVKVERFAAQAKEAAEQCERTDIPVVHDAVRLEKLLREWPRERVLFFLDETLNAADCLPAFQACKGSPAALLVGPEGGFSPEERALLGSLTFVRGVALGPRILRAETAACAALAVWQAAAGDWNKGE